jgi:tripartite-type tricarboxylate transporter receptor subunit TctC
LFVLAARRTGHWARWRRLPYQADKPVTIVVPFAAGGPTDRVARDLAEAMRKPLGGVTIVVDNAAGAGSTIGTNKVAKAARRSHPAAGAHRHGHHAHSGRNLPFKVESDFEYLGMINDVPMTLISKPACQPTTSRNCPPGSTRTRARSTWATRGWARRRTCAA